MSPMSQPARALGALAAGALAACGGGAGGTGDAPESFLAFSTTFAPFRTWTSLHSDGPVDDGTFTPDVLGPRTQYINQPPPPGAQAFPVGTELEAKVLLQEQFDRLRVAANLSGERELYFSEQRELVFSPSLGATYEVTPSFHLGIDSWLRGEYPSNPKPATRTFGLGPAAYVGPAAMFNFGKLWWAVGAYARVTDFSHKLQPGEPYGPVYVRSMIGYDL
jgi:hypothetical protein